MRLPERKQVKDLFEGLLGRDVEVAHGELIDMDTRPRPVVGSYVDDAGDLVAVTLMDLPLAAYSGAALGLVPAGGAQDAVADGELPAHLMENVAEILNILAAPIGDAGGVHVRLLESYAPHEPLPDDLARWVNDLAQRDDVAVDIAGYGVGALAVVGAAAR